MGVSQEESPSFRSERMSNAGLHRICATTSILMWMKERSICFFNRPTFPDNKHVPVKDYGKNTADLPSILWQFFLNPCVDSACHQYHKKFPPHYCDAQ